MDVREAVGSDAGALADLFDLPERATERLIRNRHVRVADTGGDDGRDIVAALAFEMNSTVRVTRLAGERDALVELLGSPVRFADEEGVPVEAFPDDETAEGALVAAGFERTGETRVGGAETPRYLSGTSER